MLNVFESWFTQNKRSLEDRHFGVTVTRASERTDKPSIRADVDTPKYLGRVTLWSSGEIESEAIDIETEETIFNRYKKVYGPEELYEFLETFLTELSLKT